MERPASADLPGRLGYDGMFLDGVCWRARVAAGLGVGRTTLHQWLTDGKRDQECDIDGEIPDLIDRERDLAAERGVAMTAPRKKFLSIKQVSS